MFWRKKKTQGPTGPDLVRAVALNSAPNKGCAFYCYVYDAFATGSCIAAGVNSEAVKLLEGMPLQKSDAESEMSAEIIEFLSTTGESKNRRRSHIAAFAARLAVDSQVFKSIRDRALSGNSPAAAHFCYVIYRDRGCPKMEFREVIWSSDKKSAATAAEVSEKIRSLIAEDNYRLDRSYSAKNRVLREAKAA